MKSYVMIIILALLAACAHVEKPTVEKNRDDVAKKVRFIVINTYDKNNSFGYQP